jgi:hypothetical protein
MYVGGFGSTVIERKLRAVMLDPAPMPYGRAGCDGLKNDTDRRGRRLGAKMIVVIGEWLAAIVTLVANAQRWFRWRPLRQYRQCDGASSERPGTLDDPTGNWIRLTARLGGAGFFDKLDLEARV